jgi:hypothetical protein
MGLTPATGTEISMGCVYGAFGLAPFPGANIGLNSTLGVNRQPPQALGVSAIPVNAETDLSVDMGGLDTPGSYCSTLTFWCENADSVLDGWTTCSTARGSTGVLPVTAYFSGASPGTWASAVSNGNVIYLDPDYTPAFTTAIGWYKTVQAGGTGEAFQINASGVPINLSPPGTCS